MPDDGAYRIRLVVRAQRRELSAALRRGAVAAAPEIIDAQHPIGPGVDAETGTDDFRPPAGGARDHPVGGDSAEYGNYRRILAAGEPERHFCIPQNIAVVQRARLRQPDGLVDLKWGSFQSHVPLAPLQVYITPVAPAPVAH